MSSLGGDVHGFLGDDLLSLAKRDVVEVVVVGRKAELHSELLDVLERVDARRQDEEDGRRWSRLLVRLGELDASSFHVLAAQFLFHVCPATRHKQRR